MDRVPNALAVRGLRKRYGSVDALKGVDLEVGEGELVGLLGPNGAGKSTLVKIAVGLVRPTRRHGRGRAEHAPARAPRARRSATSPSSSAFPAGTRPTRCSSCTSGSPARAAAPPSARGCSSSSRSRMPRSVASTACRKGCSSGSASRRRSSATPRILLLDEPTSALDPVGRRTVRLLLEELRAQGVSVLLNSHLLSEIELVCDRVAILLGGEVVAAGTPARARAPARRRARDGRGRRRRSRGRRARTRRGSSPRRSPQAGASTACACSRRRSRTPTSRRSEVRRTELGRRHRRVRLPRGRAAQGVRRRPPADRASSSFLFWLANHYVFGQLSQITPPRDVNVDTRTFAGAFLIGLAMFATLFLGVVLAVFLTLGVVSGDAERGLLQPLVVRPVGRSTLLLVALPRRRGRLRRLRPRRLLHRDGDHRAHRPLVAGPDRDAGASSSRSAS